MTRKESGFVERTMKSVHLACDAAGEDMVGTSLLIRDEVRSALTSLQSAAEGLEEALTKLLAERSGAARLSNACLDADAALSAFNAIKGK